MSLIFHSQVALSPSCSRLNSTCVPMQYLTLIPTSSSTSLPSCSLLRHPPGAPCIWPHLFHPEQSFLSCSYYKLIPVVFMDGQQERAEGEVVFCNLTVTSWQALSSKKLPSTSTALLSNVWRTESIPACPGTDPSSITDDMGT